METRTISYWHDSQLVEIPAGFFHAQIHPACAHGAGNLSGKEVGQQPPLGPASFAFLSDIYWSREQPEEPAVGVYMAFFQAAIGVLQTLVIALGAGLGIWGAINLLEGYGNDNPGANAHVR